MRFVSRDANITQFYGVAARGDDMLLISEFMEVRVEGGVTGVPRVVSLACRGGIIGVSRVVLLACGWVRDGWVGGCVGGW